MCHRKKKRRYSRRPTLTFFAGCLSLHFLFFASFFLFHQFDLHIFFYCARERPTTKALYNLIHANAVNSTTKMKWCDNGNGSVRRRMRWRERQNSTYKNCHFCQSTTCDRLYWKYSLSGCIQYIDYGALSIIVIMYAKCVECGVGRVWDDWRR